MRKLWLIKSRLAFLMRSKSRYDIHSPFVYEVVNDVLRDNTKYEDYVELHNLKKKQAKREDFIETVDFGVRAGNTEYKVLMVPRGRMVRERTTGNKRLRLLYRLSRHFKPEIILELGTGAGMSAAYLMKGFPDAKMITLEGCASLADFAEESFKKLKLKNIEIVSGHFDVTLNDIVKQENKLDLVFFDGNHRKEPTVRYFDTCLEKAHEGTVFVFDDIHWSPGMEEAWKIIKANDQVSVTIDLFWMGLVFFKKGIAKQDFLIRF